jgi:hypothetical protein
MSDTTWTWNDYAPRVLWSLPAAIPTRKVFIVTLSADGLAAFEVPVSTITLRLRDTAASYVRCTVPDPLRYTADILPRARGRMTIYGGLATADGARQLEELLYANIQRIHFDRGTTDTLSITGTRYQTHANPRAVTLAGVSDVSLARGRYAARAALDLFVRPGDTVTAAGRTFTADLIHITIRAAEASMLVEGA